MSDYDNQAPEGGPNERGPRQSFQQFPQRATASANWRMKDDTPRAEPQPRTTRPDASGARGGRSYDSPNRSYSGGQQQQRETSDTRLYVGNLLYSAARNDIEQFFTSNGFNVSGISMSVDPATGRNPSYCFVDFETADEASQAMANLNGVELLGRAVRINLGVARGSNSGPREGGGRPGFGDRGGSGRGWGQDSGASPSTGRWNRNENSTSYSSGRDQQEPQTAAKRLYIGNLPLISPQTSAEEAIQSLFSPLGIEIVTISKLISPHESKKDLPGDHHYLFVDLARAEDAETAIEALDGPGKIEADWIGAEGLKVNKARENDRRRQDRPWQSREGGGFQQREGYQPREGGYQQREGGAYQSRRQDGFKDWRKSERQE